MGDLTVEGQAFGAVSSESNEFNEYPNDGLLGMAFGTIARTRKSTFFENLIHDRKLAAPSFSVHLARNQEIGSEVRFFFLYIYLDQLQV
jgi:Eukaryotic aspartyl protease.